MNSIDDLYSFFKHFAGEIGAKCQSLPTGSDPSIKNTLEIVEKVENICASGLKDKQTSNPLEEKDDDRPIEWWVRALVVILMVGYGSYAFGIGNVRRSLGVRPDAGHWVVDVIQKLIAMIMLLVGGLWVGLLGKRI